ncbi:MAG: hypothetical protein JXQ23_03790 [Clostridia bacterium]|nr:hypothetical protein [Clostridia bacterium]
MKKLCILIVILLLISGCQKAGNQESKPTLVSEPSQVEDNQTGGLLIKDYEEINLFIPYSNANNKMDEETEIGWEKYILENFGYNINLMFFDYNNPNKEFDASGNDGIVYFLNDELYSRLIKGKRTLELNEFLENYTLADSGYLKSMETLKDIDGNVYGIPTVNYEMFEYKSYYMKFLDEVDMDVPTDLEEYRKLGEALKEKDIYLMTLQDD